MLAKRIKAQSQIRFAFSNYKRRKPFIQMQRLSLEILDFRKRRRRSSFHTYFLGNYMGDEFKNATVQSALAETKESQLRFMAEIVKVDRYMKPHERIILVTERSMYDFERKVKKQTSTYKLHNRISLTGITKISLSSLPDDLIVIHSSDADMLYSLEHRTELMATLMRTVVELSGTPFPVSISNDIDYCLKKKIVHAVAITEDKPVINGKDSTPDLSFVSSNRHPTKKVGGTLYIKKQDEVPLALIEERKQQQHLKH